MELKDHDLDASHSHAKVLYEELPLKDPVSGDAVEGLHTVRITLNNPTQLNSYTTEMVKDVILGMRRASNDRAAVAVVFTGAGDRAFCTGGNTAEYAEYYAGRPEEYRQYMRLFNDMVSSILMCDKPVVCRVNGMRIAGGQEIGMACDFTITQDLALFGQAGPKHGSAPDGGSTDFLPLFVGIETAMESCTLCEHWSAYKAHRLGLVTKVVAALKLDGAFVPNPLVVTDRSVDYMGKIVYGEPKTGPSRDEAKALFKRGTVDLAHLDAETDAMVYGLAMTMPGCLAKTIESVRKHKLEHWDRNKESNRAWLALNMMTEGRAGFRAFHEGTKACREADFLLLRRRLAEGAVWSESLVEEILASARRLCPIVGDTLAMLQVERLHGGALWDVAFGDGKGNVLDIQLVEELSELFVEARGTITLRAICLRGQGRNFSYGASVEEHLPEQVGVMLPRFHSLFRAMLDSKVVCLAAVQGQCLGGGLELASFCHRVFASPDAAFAQPEIVLGVVAPVASLFLPDRIGRANAYDLCLSGRTISSAEALGMGLVDAIDESPDEAARSYAREYLVRHSASSLRFAVVASHADLKKRLDNELPEIERLYLEELMETADANEGLQAFLEKRAPEWKNH